MQRIRFFLLAVLSCVSLSSHAEKLRVYAASSMTNVVNDIVQKFEESNEVEVITVYGGSASLARQLAQGAPADIYISANQKWMDYLIQQQVVASDDVTNVASNELVVVAPKHQDSELIIHNAASWTSNLDGLRLAIGQTNAVPAGIYAKESLQSLGVWSEVKNHLAPANNVRVALTLVERKETPLGIVYKTDAMLSEKTEIVATLPSNTHSAIIYPMAVFNNQPVTLKFAEYMLSDQTQQLLSRFGFSRLTE